MADKYLIEPDVEFIEKLQGLGGDTLKKCFQCATCSVACPIAPDNKPFPRKEMIAASWGLKDRLVNNGDIWLCHNCGDCTTMCPRGAKPGDVLGAVRAYAIEEYATPKSLAKMVNNPKMLLFFLVLPALLFLILGGVIDTLFGVNWINFSPGGEEIVHGKFFSTWLVDLIFVPTSLWVVAVFGLGLTRFLKNIHENALLEGKTDKEKIEVKGFLTALWRILPTILKHKKFSECGENEARATSHLMVFYSFIGLFIVTGCFFFSLYVLQQHGPYPQLCAVKWLANVSGIALVIGTCLMIKDRLVKTDEVSAYKDWYLLGIVLGVGLTGMLTEMTRLGGIAGLSYFIYFVHLVLVFNLFAFLPFSKLAHLVYRTVAMTYAEYTGRT